MNNIKTEQVEWTCVGNYAKQPCMGKCNGFDIYDAAGGEWYGIADNTRQTSTKWVLVVGPYDSEEAVREAVAHFN